MRSSIPAEEDWLRYKLILRKLRDRKGSTTRWIMEQMKKRYSFDASKNAYDRQFQAWGWRKNLSDEDCYAANRAVEKRKRDQGKQSEVQRDGLVIDIQQRWKRHRLTYSKKLEMDRQPTPPLPSDITVQTPPNLVEYDLQADIINLPWLFFLKNAREQILGNAAEQNLQVYPADSQAFSLCAKFGDIALDIAPDSMNDLSVLAGFLGRILPSDADSEAVLSLVYKLAKGEQQIEDTTLSKLLSSIVSLGVRQGTQVIELIASIEGPLATSLISAFLIEVFESERSGTDSTDIARILLKRTEGLLNSEIRYGNLNQKLVDHLWSASMAKLFIAHGGELALARRPFQRLLEEDPLNYIDLCKLFVQSDHADLQHASLCSHIRFNLSLVHAALCRCRKFDGSLVLAHEMEHDDEETAVSVMNYLRRQPDSEAFLSRTLTMAAKFGYVKCVNNLISGGVNLSVSVSVRQDFGRENGLWIDRSWKFSGESRPCLATALQFAIACRHFEIAASLIEAGASAVRPFESDLESPLQLALEANNAEIALRLLAKGAICDAVNFPAVMMAVGTKDERLVKELLHMGADPNMLPHQTPGYMTTSFALAVQHFGERMAPSLHKKGACLTRHFRCASACLRQRPLSEKAAISGLCIKDTMSMGFVRSLNITGTDLNVLHHPGGSCTGFISSPLTWTMGDSGQETHDHELIRYLISLGAEVDLQGTTNSTFDLALENNCIECLDILLAAGTTELAQELFVEAAARHARHNLLKQSLAFGATQHFASRNEPDLPQTIGPIDHNLARAALTGAITRWRHDEDGSVFLHMLDLETDFTAACMTVILRELCDMACDRFRDEQLSKTDVIGAITRLLQAGVPVDAPNDGNPFPCCGLYRERDSEMFNRSCLWTSVNAGRQDLTELLLKYKANPNKWHLSSWITEHPDRMEDLDSSEICPGPNSLSCAARRGNIDMMRKLISAGGAVYEPVTWIKGLTPLQEAVEHNNLEMVKFLLHEVGANPNETNKVHAETTALIIAAEKGNILIAHELIKAGANVNGLGQDEEDDNTALVAAAEKGHLDMVAYLIQKGAGIGEGEDWQFADAENCALMRGFPVIAKFLFDEWSRLYPESRESGRRIRS